MIVPQYTKQIILIDLLIIYRYLVIIHHTLVAAREGYLNNNKILLDQQIRRTHLTKFVKLKST